MKTSKWWDKTLTVAVITAAAGIALGLLEERFEQEETEPSTLNMPALEANAGRRVPLDPRRRERDKSIAKNLQAAIVALEPLIES